MHPTMRSNPCTAIRRATALAALVWGAARCASKDAGTPEPPPPPLCQSVKRTCAEVKGYAWSKAVTVECNDADELFTVRASGLPPEKADVTMPKLEAQDWEFLVPLSPRCATAREKLEGRNVPQGLMLNGVGFFTPFDTNGDDLVKNAMGLDECQGMPGVGCTYQYRSLSPCIFGASDDVAKHLEKDGHGARVGLALDGFELFATPTIAGEPPLDACHGHETATRGYHYHASADAPYLMSCFVGATRGDLRYTATLPEECLQGSSGPSMSMGSGPPEMSGTGGMGGMGGQ